MLLQLFKAVLLQSAVGTILTIALLLLKPVTKKIFGICWQYYIWLCVLMVMILPLLVVWIPEKPIVSLPVLPQIESEKAYKTIAALPDSKIKIVETTPFEYSNVKLAKGFQISRQYQYNLFTYVWIVGALMFFLRNIKNYLLFFRTIRKHSKSASCAMLKSLKEEKKIRSNIRILTTQCINSPLILGFFQPTLLLPDTEISAENLRNVLLHELTHYKRHDLWYKWFSMIVNSIHWFNPIIYLVVRQMNEECELSCDFSVVQDMNIEERKGYMSTILCMVAKNKTTPTMLVSQMSDGKGQIKRRLKMISKERRRSKFVSALSFLTAVAIFCTTFFPATALAAGVQNGLEPWTNNEIYFKGAIQFSVNVTGKNVPAWVFENVAGEDGNINVTVNWVQIRDVKGAVGEYAIIALNGTKGEVKLSDIGREGLRKTYKSGSSELTIPELSDATYISNYRFCEFNNPGYEGYRQSPVASLVTENSGKRESVMVYFAFNESRNLSAAYLDFLVTDKSDNVNPLGSSYTPVKADFNSIKYLGNFQKDKKDFSSGEMASMPYYFTFLEKNFENKKIEGINITVKSADTQAIKLNASVTHPQVSFYAAFVYDKDERMIAYKEEKGVPAGSIALEPPRYYNRQTSTNEVVPGHEYVRGEKYRVDMVLFDKEHKVIYRQRETVKEVSR